VNRLFAPVFAPGFFTSGQVHTALVIGVAVSVVSAVVGVFTVIRGQAFAGHALADIGASGGSAAFLVGVGPLWGFVASGLGAAAAMELIGIQRARGRDLAAGIVLGASLGLAALFLYLASIDRSISDAPVTVLFGSLLAVPSSTAPAVAVLCLLALAAIAVVQRPLLISSLSPELAAGHGIAVRAIGATYLVALALAVALSALTVGAILSTALLIGPAASAARLARRPGQTVALAAALGAITMIVSVVLAYDSYTWPPRGYGWPVSFFVVTLTLAEYLLAAAVAWRQSRRAPALRRLRPEPS
jgi:zinc/manganese transport system permease protein